MTSEDVDQLFEIGWYSIVGGGLIGGMVGVRESAQRHRLENKDTRYPNHYMAQKHFNNSVLLGFFRYGIRWAGKVGFVGTLFG